MNFSWDSPAPSPSLTPDQRLARLLDEAAALHDFAVSNGRVIPKEIHDRFLAVWSALSERLEKGAPAGKADTRLDLDQEFRVLYELLNKAMAPVSAESIRATKAARARTLFRPTLTTSLIALVLFAFIVVLQGFWVVGKRYWDRTGDFDKQRAELVRKQDAARDETSRIRARQSILDCDEGPRPSFISGLAIPQSGTVRNEAKDNGPQPKDCVLVNELQQAAQRQDLELTIQQREIQRVDALAQPVLQLLENWYDWALAATRQIRTLFFAAKSLPESWAEMRITRRKELEKEMQARISRVTGKESNEMLRDQFSAARPVASSFFVGESEWRSPRAFSSASPKSREELEAQRAEEEKRQEISLARLDAQRKLAAFDESRIPLLLHSINVILSVIQGYVLPALLGALGAVVFLLRTTAQRLNNWTYVRESAAQWFAHVVVGTMAGVLGGWFMPDTTSISPSIPALAIPFLLGYGVELFFGLLDRASRALSADAATPPRSQ